MRERFGEVWHNWQGASWKLFLVFAIGWSFVNAVQLAMRLIESGEDRGHGDDPREIPEPPPDDGLTVERAKRLREEFFMQGTKAEETTGSLTTEG